MIFLSKCAVYDGDAPAGRLYQRTYISSIETFTEGDTEVGAIVSNGSGRLVLGFSMVRSPRAKAAPLSNASILLLSNFLCRSGKCVLNEALISSKVRMGSLSNSAPNITMFNSRRGPIISAISWAGIITQVISTRDGSRFTKDELTISTTPGETRGSNLSNDRRFITAK